MEKYSLKEFRNSLSWSSKMYFLLVISLIAFGLLTDVGSIGWMPAVLYTLGTIMTIELIAVLFRQHPKTLNMIGWIILLILLAFFIIGFKS